MKSMSKAQRRVGKLKPEICANLRLLIKVFVVGETPTTPRRTCRRQKENPLLLCVGARGFRLLDGSVLHQKHVVVLIHFVQYVARPFGKQSRTIAVQTPLLSFWVRRADDSELF